MRLTTFSGEMPALKDIGVAKNYLDENELKILNNLVSGYFDFAEISAIEHKPMYMSDYVKQLDTFLSSGGRPLLQEAETISHARANCKNIKFIDERGYPLCFTDERIEEAITQTSARLMILDPLSAYIGHDVRINQANEVRASFRPLYEVASRTGCAILIVSHMNKMQGTASLYRTNGSVDVAGAVSSILLSDLPPAWASSG